jgi:hypothetical protein
MISKRDRIREERETREPKIQVEIKMNVKVGMKMKVKMAMATKVEMKTEILAARARAVASPSQYWWFGNFFGWPVARAGSVAHR